MEKFQNQTIEGNEKSIKIGSRAVSGSVPLVWFSSEGIKPSNTLNISDVSYLIPENVVGNIESELVCYADELGVLRKMNGSSSFKTNNLTVSNIFIDRPSFAEGFSEDQLENLNFAHYYYISRFFIAAPKDYSASSIRQYLNPDKLIGIKILVANSNGSEYVDVDKSIKKYRILLEPFKTDQNLANDVIPYRVIVVFDSDRPENIRLIYDKVECDSNGLILNQEINYSETVNAIPIFSQKPEESFVIDKNYFGENIFAAKKLNQKYSELILDKVDDNGYQIFTTSKAIEDNRSYEVFNWRLIAKSKSSVSLDPEDFPSNDDLSSYRTVKVGILYSSRFTSDIKDPYIFYRLENSPFNLSKFRFINPANNNVIPKNRKDYWLVDIESANLSNYDVLAFQPSFRLSPNHITSLKRFVSNNGSLLLDLSRSRFGIPEISGLSISSTVSMANHSLNSDSEVIDVERNGGWTINSSIFEKPEYSIHGSSLLQNGSYKKVKRFANPSTISEYGRYNYIITHSSSPTAVHITTRSTGDRLTGGNIFAVTFPFFRYCNDQYSVAGVDSPISSNNGSVSVDDGSSNVLSAVVEGPFKFLYNIVCYSLYSQMMTRGSRVDFRSPLYNYVSDWRSGWVMDSDVLLDDEKGKYFTPISISPSDNVYALDILNKEQVGTSLINFYKNELSSFLTDVQKSRLSSIDSSQIDFYIEVTNPDVSIYNSEASQRVESNSVNGLNSSYYLHKLESPDSKVFAYTKVKSPELYIPDNMGPYVMVEKPFSTSDTRLLSDGLDRNANFKDYDFDIYSYYNYYSASDSPQSFTVKTNFTGRARATGSVSTGYYRPVAPTPVEVEVEVSTKSYSEPNASNFKSAVDDIGLFRATSTNQPTNVFPYTGDIELGNTWKIWRHDAFASNHVNRGDFARYVQFTLWTYNNFYGGTRNYYPYGLDDHYGPRTSEGVKKFQRDEGARYIDGRVDSETKWLMARFWKRVYNERRDIWNASFVYFSAFRGNGYMTAAKDAAVAADINSKYYRKTTFSGVVNPREARDVIFFELPESLSEISKVNILIESSWANCRVVGYGRATTWNSVYTMPNRTSTNKSPVAGVITLNVGRIRPGNDLAKYMWVEIYGDSISNGSNDHRHAEGFSIRNISCYGYSYVTTTTTRTEYRENPSVWVPQIRNTQATINFSIEEYPKIVDPSAPVTHSLSSTQSYYDLIQKSSKAYISSIIIDGVTYSFNSDQFSLKDIINGSSSSSYTQGDTTINFSNSTISQYAANDHSIASIVDNDNNNTIWQSGDSASLMPISVDRPSFSISNGSYILRYQTSSTYYSGSSVSRVGPVSLPANYSLRTVDGAVLYGSSKKSVNVNDGVMLICDTSGRPAGFPSASVINSGLNSINSSLDDEIDTRFGFFSLINLKPSEDGFIFGFYDVLEREFIGTVISYIELMNRNKSGNNVYIGVLAYDADGNTNNIDYIGPSRDMVFTPAVLPIKYIAPVFSVKFNSESAIRVGNIPDNLSKFEAWELPLTSGSFTKTINIPTVYTQANWLSDYLGKDILAFYETSRSSMSSWSDIYGYGSYDVYAENPIILDNERIQLRKTPVLAWNHPTDYDDSIFGIIKPVVEVYFMNTITGSWDKVPSYDIRNIDCANGIVEFKPRKMPSISTMIRVNYSVENKDLLIRQINGDPIPLNPFLNVVDYKKPMYIYLLPKKIYVYDESVKNYSLIESYNSSSSVMFTYDSNIFNKASSLYNPFALPISVISTSGNPRNKIPNYRDIRTRGGGLVDDVSIVELMNDNSNVLYNWDIYPPSAMAYPNGGYVIIKIPREVENNFLDRTEVYDIVRSNLTAGVVFDLQDMEGNSWS